MTHSKEYVLGELFTLSKPRARSIKQYEPGDVPFVSPWIHNNGVTAYKQPKPGETLDPANTVTVTPLAGVAFYQPEPYLGRGGGGSAITILTRVSLQTPGYTSLPSSPKPSKAQITATL